MQELRGTGTALVTPFDEKGNIDFDALKQIINYNIDGGVEFLVSLGTTGEAVTISQKDCQAIFDFTVEEVNGRVPVVLGVFGSNNTQIVIDRLDIYNTDGASALLSASPYYNKPTQEGIFQHYKQFSDHSDLPIIIYNVPGRTASNIEAETTLRIAEELEQVIGIKEASGDLVQFSKIMKHKPSDFMVWSGDDPTAFASTCLGGDGVISVISNVLPYEFSEMIRNALSHDIAKARDLNSLVLDLHDWLYAEGNPVGVKAALEMLGFCGREVRLPLVAYSRENYDQMKDVLTTLRNQSPYAQHYHIK